ncbi:MAG: DUF11 domain-containing protein, partial [Deferribacteres bacterium]|nr:DUF11 domain-containing protein [Deferribacteres bacterium]
MRTTNVNPKRGYGLLIFLLALLLQTNTLSAQDSCSTYSYYFNYPGKRVFSDTTLWHDWYRSVEYEVNDFPEEGYFHVQAYILYNSENRQQNESLYLLVKNSTIRYPQNPNAQSQTDSAAYFVVPDDPTAHFDEFRIRNAGTFYFEKGHNVIQFNHYKKIVEQFPQFVNYYPGHDSLSPGVNSGKLLGGIRSGESVDCYMIALIPVNCSQDLQLQTEPRFSTNCLDSTGTLQMNFHINELTQQQFTTESIDSLVFKISSDSTVSFTGESPGWQSHIETKDQTVWTFVWHPQSNDVPLTELAEMLQLKVDMANFKAPVEAQITSQLFLKQDINPDNQYIKNTVPLQLDCSTPAVDLSVTKNGIWQSFLNSETIDYQIIVKNESTTPVANFIVRDSLDSRLQPVNFSLEPDIMGNTLVWQISETINPNETYSLVYSAQLPDSLHLSTSIILPNYVFVDTPNDANPNNNSDSTRHVYKTLDLSLEQFANVDTFCINDTINFTYLIHNNSPSTAYRIALQTQVPKALHLFERNEWNTIDSTADFYILKTNIDSLPGFNSFTATIKGIVLDSLTSTLRNPALVEVRNDSLLVNNAGQVALSAGSCSIPNEHVPFADLLIIKSISQDTAKTGDFFTYYIIATNLGPDSVSDFYLLEKMPAGIRIENMQTAHNISVSSDTIRWPGVSLAAGDSLQLHISAQMMTPANSTFQIFTNSISIISDADTLTANNADSASIVLRPVALV